MDYVYKFINYSDEIIYIGKTGNIKKRMNQHFLRGHLPDECYQNVKQIFFCLVDGKTNTEIMETFLINKYHPVFNTDKKFSEDVNRHIDGNVLLNEPEWRELYIDYCDNGLLVSESPILPQYYNQRLDDKSKCIEILKHNVNMLQYRQGFYHKYIKGIDDFKKFIEYFIIIHREIMLDFDVSNSSVDIPITFDNASEFVAFDINSIKTINLEYLMMLSNMHLISHLFDTKYALFVHNKYVMESIPVVF